MKANERKNVVTAFLTVAMMFVATNAFAGAGGTEFTEVYELIQGWTQGFLGKTLSVGMFLTGIAIGVVKQSLMSIALGVGSGMAVYYTPNVIDSVVTATIM